MVGYPDPLLTLHIPHYNGTHRLPNSVSREDEHSIVINTFTNIGFIRGHCGIGCYMCARESEGLILNADRVITMNR
jgi:hypothetical protein